MTSRALIDEHNAQVVASTTMMADSQRVPPPPPVLVAMACEEAPATTADTPRIALAFDEEIENQTGDSRGRRPLTLECAAGATLFYSTRLAMALAPPQLAARARQLRCSAACTGRASDEWWRASIHA